MAAKEVGCGKLLTNPPPHLQGNLSFRKTSKFGRSRPGFVVVLNTVIYHYNSEKAYKRGHKYDFKIYLEEVCGIAETLLSGKYKNSSFKLTLGDTAATEMTKQEMERWVSGLRYAKEFWTQYSKRQELQKMNEQTCTETVLPNACCGDVSSVQREHVSEGSSTAEEWESIVPVLVTTWDGLRHKLLLPRVFDREELFSAAIGKLHGITCSSCPICKLQQSSMEVWTVSDNGHSRRIALDGEELDVAVHGFQFYLLVHNYKLLVIHFEDNTFQVFPCLISIKAKEVPYLPVLANKLSSLGRDNIGLFLVNEMGTSIPFAPDEEPLRHATQGKLTLRSKALNIQVTGASGDQNLKKFCKARLKRAQQYRDCQKALKKVEKQQCQRHTPLTTASKPGGNVGASDLVFCEDYFHTSDIELRQSIGQIPTPTHQEQTSNFAPPVSACGGMSEACSEKGNLPGAVQVQHPRGTNLNQLEIIDGDKDDARGLDEREIQGWTLVNGVHSIETTQESLENTTRGGCSNKEIQGQLSNVTNPQQLEGNAQRGIDGWTVMTGSDLSKPSEGFLDNTVSVREYSGGEIEGEPSKEARLPQRENSDMAEKCDHNLAVRDTPGQHFVNGVHSVKTPRGSVDNALCVRGDSEPSQDYQPSDYEGRVLPNSKQCHSDGEDGLIDHGILGELPESKNQHGRIFDESLEACEEGLRTNDITLATNSFTDRDENSNVSSPCCRSNLSSEVESFESHNTRLTSSQMNETAIMYNIRKSGSFDGDSHASTRNSRGELTSNENGTATCSQRHDCSEDVNAECLYEGDDGKGDYCNVLRETDTPRQIVTDKSIDNSDDIRTGEHSESPRGVEQSIADWNTLSIAEHPTESLATETSIDQSLETTVEARYHTFPGRWRIERCRSCGKRTNIRTHQCDYYTVGSPRVLRLVLKMFSGYNAQEEEVGETNELARICLSGWHLRYHNGIWQVEEQVQSSNDGTPLSSGVGFHLPGGLKAVFHEDEKCWTVTGNQDLVRAYEGREDPTLSELHSQIKDVVVLCRTDDIQDERDATYHPRESEDGSCETSSRIRLNKTPTRELDHNSYYLNSKTISSVHETQSLRTQNPRKARLRAAIQRIFQHIESSTESQEDILDDSKHERICEIVCGPLCTSLSDILSEGIRKKKTLIPVKYSVWNIVEHFRDVSREADQIVQWVNGSRYTSLDESRRFKAFVCECLNMRNAALYQWFDGVLSPGDRLAKYYNQDGIVFQLSPEQLEELKLEISRLSFLPFNLHFDKWLKKKGFRCDKGAFTFE